MAEKQLMERAEQALYKVYNRFPVVFDHGEGVELYDTERNEYLDFGAGIAVMALGYGGGEYTKAVEDRLRKLTHISNLFHNQPSIEAGEKLPKASHIDKVLFTNSGTEAIEGALKIAKRFHYNKLHETMGDGCYGCEDTEPDMTGEIIAMNHSSHGRSLGALSVTSSTRYREPFKPLVPGIRFADLNDLGSVKKLTNSRACTVIMEIIQREGGICPATEEFLKGVRALCDEHDLLLILDETQCGMGRSRETFAWQYYGVKSDVMTVTKTLGNELPTGALLACGKAVGAMVPGDHGTTYGGNPLVTAGASAVFDIFEKRCITDHVKEIGAYLYEKLEELSKELDCVRGHRGMGLIQGLKFSVPAGLIVSKALLEQRLVLISAGTNIIRFVPSLMTEKADVGEMMKRLKACLKTAFRQRKEQV